MLVRVEDYQWSSDRFYRKNINSWVEIVLVMDMLSADRKMAVHKYIEFIIQENTEKFDFTRKSRVDSGGRREEAGLDKKPGRKNLDEILLETGVNEQEFQLIKSGSRKRNLSGYKLAYAVEALKLSYTLKAIGENIQVSAVAILDMLRKQNLIN